MKGLLARLRGLKVQETIHKVFDEDGNDVTPKPLADPYKRKVPTPPGILCSYSTVTKSPSIQGSDRSGEPHPTFSETGSARLEGLLRPVKIVKASQEKKTEAPHKVETLSVKLTLSETNTMWLLELPSTALPVDSPQAEELTKQIQRYDWLTKGKGQNRKLVDAETQTLDLQAKRKATQTTPIETASVHTFVSAWDLYDTYEKSDVCEEVTAKDGRMFVERTDGTFAIKDMDSFLQSGLIMERLLASNNFRHKQALFTGYPEVSESGEKASRFQYKLCPLWIYQSSATRGRSVMSFSWNHANKDLLAVGYGQFLATDEVKPGLVCCWSVKNPTQPERSFSLSQPVTCLNFSRDSSRVLAVGLKDGAIALLDVTSRDKLPYTTSSGSRRQHCGPVWCLQWCSWAEGGRELLVSTGEDGQVCRWTLANNFYSIDGTQLHAPLHMICIDMMQGSSTCCDMPVQKFLSGLDFSLCLNENPPTLYVATKEGYLVEIERELQCRGLRKVHRGPVYSVQASPFCHQVVLTAGADGNICFWTRGCEQPLLSLSVADDAIVGAAWSPSHSTVVACASGNLLSLWDIGRKTHEPVASVLLDNQLTALSFCPAGKNLLLGDRTGNVHVYSLQDMPYAPYMQVEALTRAVPGLKNYLTSPETKISC